jgi:hypothetical protein
MTRLRLFFEYSDVRWLTSGNRIDCALPAAMAEA